MYLSRGLSILGVSLVGGYYVSQLCLAILGLCANLAFTPPKLLLNSAIRHISFSRCLAPSDRVRRAYAAVRGREN